MRAPFYSWAQLHCCLMTKFFFKWWRRASVSAAAAAARPSAFFRRALTMLHKTTNAHHGRGGVRKHSSHPSIKETPDSALCSVPTRRWKQSRYLSHLSPPCPRPAVLVFRRVVRMMVGFLASQITRSLLKPVIAVVVHVDVVPTVMQLAVSTAQLKTPPWGARGRGICCACRFTAGALLASLQNKRKQTTRPRVACAGFL